jgi:hypothetical protein
MNLKFKSNQDLIVNLKLKVENERKLLMEILYSLQEVERRMLHLEMGYPDLYTFAIKELGYSSGAAYRRVSAMRLLKSLPDVAPKLQSGELGLENASQAQSFFRKEDQRRKENGEERLTLETKREVVTELLGKSTRDGLKVLLSKSPEIMTPSEKIRPVSEEKTLVQFVAHADLMEKLEELKGLLAHQNYDGRMDVLIERLADIALQKLKPKAPESKSQEKVMPVTHTDLSPAPGMISVIKKESLKKSRSRYIPIKERRKVLLKYPNGCTYKDPKSDRVCGSKHGLQLDHIQPFSQGGSHSAQNLTVLCGAHNRYRAERTGLI